MTLQERLLFEAKSLLKGIQQTKFRKITKKKIISELVTNGVAAIIALLSTKLLSLFFIVPSIKNIFAFQERRSKIKVDSETFSILSWVLVFTIGLIVFTIVEQVMENYLKERENKQD